MPRFNRRRGMAPVVSVKNIVDLTATGVSAGVTTDLVVATGVNNYTGLATEVPIGGQVKNIYISYSYNFNQGFPTRMDMFVGKADGPIGPVNFPVPGNTTGSVYRKFIFLEIKGLGSASSDAFGQDSQIRGFSGWLKIPKRFRRMGEGDRLFIRFGSASDYNICVKVIYKAFS